MVRPVLAICIAATASFATANASPSNEAPAAWQTDFGKFVDAYRACASDARCNVDDLLAGKTVTWEGNYSSQVIEGNVVYLQMWPEMPILTDRNGTMRTISCCRPSVASVRGWIGLTPGQIVRFRATFPNRVTNEQGPILLYGGPNEPPSDPPRWVTPVNGPVAVVRLTEAQVVSVR